MQRAKVGVSNRRPVSTSNERSQSKKRSSSMGGVGCDGRCDERRWSKGAVIDGGGGVSRGRRCERASGNEGQLDAGCSKSAWLADKLGPFTVLSAASYVSHFQSFLTTFTGASSAVPFSRPNKLSECSLLPCIRKAESLPLPPLQLRSGMRVFTQGLHAHQCIASRTSKTGDSTHRCGRLPLWQDVTAVSLPVS